MLLHKPTCPWEHEPGWLQAHTDLHGHGHGVTAEVNQLQSLRHTNQRFTSGQGKNSGALHAHISDLWVLCSLCIQTQTRLCYQHLCAGTFPWKESGWGTWAPLESKPTNFQGSGCYFIAHPLLCYPLHKVWRVGFWCLSTACSQGQETLRQQLASTHISSSHQTAETTRKDETTWILNRTPSWGAWGNKKAYCSMST